MCVLIAINFLESIQPWVYYRNYVRSDYGANRLELNLCLKIIC